MSKKNKGGKTPSAKAERNLEALKKAKAAAIAAEAKEEKVETPPAEEKKEEKKPEPKPTPAPKKTAYESYLEYKKHPHMTILSQKIEKNEKGVEIITTYWKNNETNEGAKNELSTAFSASFVKKGDGIDLKKLREQAEKGMKEYYAEKAKDVPKEEPKPETASDPNPELKKEEKKEEKKPAAKKAKKEEVIIPEEVKPEEVKQKPIVKPEVKTTVTLKNDRIDANHGIELMKSFENRAAELEKGTELHKAMREQADIMLFVYGKQWVDQCIADGDEAFLKVSESMYNRMAVVGRDLLGITVKALPDKKDGQMTIDFKETLETAPTEVKESLEADAKKEKPSDVIPEANASATEEEKIKAIDSILRMRNGIGGNLHNAIQYSKNAFPELKDALPAQVVAFIYSKVVNSTYLNGVANAIMGNLMGNGSIIASHAWLKKQMSGLAYDETDVANIVKVVLANGLNGKGDYEVLSKSCNNYIKQMNSDLINRIVSAKTPKDEAKLKINGKYTELGAVQQTISATKFINRVKDAYGADMGDKLLKQTMQRIMGLYSDGLKPLALYVEKSTYAVKK
jgi:hypothetical protein